MKSNVQESVARAVRAELLRIVTAPGSTPDDVAEASQALSSVTRDLAAEADALVQRTLAEYGPDETTRIALEIMAVFERAGQGTPHVEMTPGCPGSKPPGR